VAAVLDPAAEGFVKFRADRITINEIAKLLAKLRGQELAVKPIGTMEELKTRIGVARDRGEVGWDVMPLFYTYYMQKWTGVSRGGPG
jgi:hypothetical protein